MTAPPVRLLRLLGRIEGVSFLVLLGVAMPLKYLAGLPLAVTLVGWIHGILFVAFCLALARVFIGCRWPLGRTLAVFVAALIPFGPFLIDPRLRDIETGEESGDPDPAVSPAPDGGPAQGSVP